MLWFEIGRTLCFKQDQLRLGWVIPHLEFFVQQKKNMELMRAGQRRSITLSHASQDILVQSTLYLMQFIGLSAS